MQVGLDTVQIGASALHPRHVPRYVQLAQIPSRGSFADAQVPCIGGGADAAAAESRCVSHDQEDHLLSVGSGHVLRRTFHVLGGSAGQMLATP